MDVRCRGVRGHHIGHRPRSRSTALIELRAVLDARSAGRLVRPIIDLLDSEEEFR